MEAGSYICKEGDSSTNFYLLIEGEACAQKLLEGVNKNVMDYKSGDYFGELALLNNQPRAASIYAKVLFLW